MDQHVGAPQPPANQVLELMGGPVRILERGATAETSSIDCTASVSRATEPGTVPATALRMVNPELEATDSEAVRTLRRGASGGVTIHLRAAGRGSSPEPLDQCPHGLAAMADGVLLVVVQLGHRAPVRLPLGQEHGVIAKSSGASRRRREPA